MYGYFTCKNKNRIKPVDPTFCSLFFSVYKYTPFGVCKLSYFSDGIACRFFLQ